MKDQGTIFYPKILKGLSWQGPRIVDRPIGKRILVLAPHPDDDILACGGTLIKHRNSGDEITSVYLTDGGKGGKTYDSDKQLVEERERESRSAGELIGLKRQIFLRHRDQELKATSETVDEMTALLAEIKPDTVYLPFILDGFYHRDHMETNRILAKAMAVSEHVFICSGYELYSPLVPNTLVDVTKEMHLKIAAIRTFKTQLAVRDYLAATVSLNRFRGLTFGSPGTKFMEAYYCADRDAYCELLRFVLSGSEWYDE